MANLNQFNTGITLRDAGIRFIQALQPEKARSVKCTLLQCGTENVRTATPLQMHMKAPPPRLLQMQAKRAQQNYVLVEIQKCTQQPYVKR